MRILVVNPNSTASMTRKIGEAAGAVAAPGTDIIATNPTGVPVSIEGPYDEALCVAGLLREVEKGVADGADAIVIACADDPGRDACRALVDRPVIGICEAAMIAASLIAARFQVVTTLPLAIPVIEDLAHHYGFTHKCQRVRAANMPVLALEDEGTAAADLLRVEIAAAKADGAEAVVLGCAGMADLAAALSAELSIPVIDGVAAGVKLAEAMVGLGHNTSKLGLYSPPRDKSDTALPTAAV
ncbi:MAG: aspartate/glutamate racemase family protein [Pseudomonadota bacterium]